MSGMHGASAGFFLRGGGGIWEEGPVIFRALGRRAISFLHGSEAGDKQTFWMFYVTENRDLRK